MKHPIKASFRSGFQRVRARRWLYATMAALLAAGIPGIASTASMSTVKLVSINKDRSDTGTGESTFPSVSADGRRVAFYSEADDLVATDSNGKRDVFVRSLQGGTTTLVSVNKDGTGSGAGDSFLPFISANGRYVVFSSNADDLVAGDANGKWDVFVRDLQSDTTTLVSVNKDGTGSGDGNSGYCDCGNIGISADGRFVVFYSRAHDLVETESSNLVDVFVRDLQSGTTTLVNVNKDGTAAGDKDSFNPGISADGRFVAYNSSAGNLVANDTNGDIDVFVRDLQSGTTTLASVNKDGSNGGNGSSFLPVLSADGRSVAFVSNATNLAAADSNGNGDIFVRNLQSGTTTLVSINRDGTDSGMGSSYAPALSADGRFVTFESSAGDLVPIDSNGVTDVFVRDLRDGITTLVSVNKDGTDSGSSVSLNSFISSDGRFVIFASGASNLVNTDSNRSRDVFLRDLHQGITTLVSVNRDGTDSGDSNSLNCAISADGRVVVFISNADDLTVMDNNAALDVFAFEMFEASKSCNCLDPRAIKGTSGTDFLYGTEQADIICGFDDQDFIAGQGGDDCIDGGEGDDWIFGGRGNDTILGKGGNDIIYGDRGNDQISGDSGDDYLFGGLGDDRLDGGEGYDWVSCDGGTDEGTGEHVTGCEN